MFNRPIRDLQNPPPKNWSGSSSLFTLPEHQALNNHEPRTTNYEPRTFLPAAIHTATTPVPKIINSGTMPTTGLTIAWQVLRTSHGSSPARRILVVKISC